MVQDEEENGTVVSTVRGSNSFVPPIEIVERVGGNILLRQADQDQILVDRTQLRKLWHVLGMHIAILDLNEGASDAPKS